MGLTSEAKRKQMNLDSPLYGFLTDRMQVANQGEFSLRGGIHPKIEPEIAFLIQSDLAGRVTREQVLESCSAIAPCMEILDSRYEQFKYFSMEDVIADNSSSSHFVTGGWIKDFRSLDLKSLAMQMSVDGKIAQQGISRDISGDPVISVIQLCELLFARSRKLTAGSIVLAGAATAAVELKPGMRVELSVASLPPVSLTVKS
jgi:2-oxo-3-hexenedioate decarboxylase